MTTVPFQEKSHYRLAGGDMEVRERAWADALPMRAVCWFCGEMFDGSAGEAREWARGHREAVHPQARDRGVAARRKAAKEAPTSYGRFNAKVER